MDKLRPTLSPEKRPRPHLAVALGLLWSLMASQAMGQLRIDLSVQNRERGSAALRQAREGVYGIRNSIGPEKVRAVRCSEGGELSTVQSKIVVPKGCGDLTWEFGLAPYPVQGVVASRQSSLFSDKLSWWILSERDAMLNSSGLGAASNIAFFLDDRPLDIQAGPRGLPALNQPPGFWLLGDPVHVDRGNVRHFFDRETIPQHLAGLLDSHSDGIGYLLEALPEPVLPPVFWMGLEEWQLSVGGAAGTGLVLANYPLRAEDFDKAAHAITLYVVLHEHAHHLFDEAGSLWIGESLASYLAIKAMKETARELYPVIENAFIVPGRTLETPLPVLAERAAAGDGQAYMRVYTGAAFWMAIDDAMVSQHGQSRLLQVLPEMLARGFAPGGAPRPDEIGQVTGLAPESLNPILDHYLGTG